MDDLSEIDLDLVKFLRPPDQWPNFKGYLSLSALRCEIRLLKIFFSPGTQDICAQVNHASLKDNDTHYEALSYSWGPPDRLKSVWINGQEVFIRASLHSFLFVLCQRGQVLPIWIDAICINQQDVQERNWQVRMMGDIYSCAVRTNVWLGESNPETEYCLSYLQHCQNSSLQKSQYQTRVLRKACESFEEVLKRPYWTRLWIVQEVTLAREVFIWCGLRRLAWEDFVNGTKLLAAGAELQQKPLTTILELQASRECLNPLIATSSIDSSYEEATSDTLGQSFTVDRRRAHMPKLEQRIKQFKNQKCEDIRDKVYALKSVTCDGERIEVDYRKNIIQVLFHLVSNLQESLFRILDIALSLWNDIDPPPSTESELFFKTNIASPSVLSESPFEFRFEYNSSLIMLLISWAEEFEQSTILRKSTTKHRYETYEDTLFDIGDFVFIPSRPGDWPRPEDIICRNVRKSSSLLRSAHFILRLDDVRPSVVRVAGCLIDKCWSPLVINSQHLHQDWARKQMQICKRIEIDPLGQCTLHLHYSQEALLLMMGAYCARDFDYKHPAIERARTELDKHALLDMCDCEPNNQSAASMETFHKVAVQQARGWVNFPGKLPRVREAIQLRSERLTELEKLAKPEL